MRGHEVDVLERATEPRPIGAGLLLQPPGARILGALGALEAVEATAARITRLDSTTPGGRSLIKLDYRDLGPGLHGLGLTRPAIWSALWDAALCHGARLIPGCDIVEVTTGAASATALSQDGVARRYDLIVTASGSNPALWRGRRHVSRPYPWGCLWASVPLPEGWRLDVLAQRCAGRRVMVGILPIGSVAGQQLGALYWSLPNHAIETWRERPFQEWRDALAKVWPDAEPIAARLERGDFEHAVYRDVWAAPPYSGRLVVIGDAAHGTSPQLGQGTTQALRDAQALAEALALPLGLEAQLGAYWRERKARTAFYRMASRGLTPVFQSNSAILGWLRDLLAGPMGAIPFVRRQALLTLAGAKTGLWSAETLPEHAPSSPMPGRAGVPLPRG
jgi:2-polyprenyl-6-methoxyphenol hydroxylase-like FAD-dependent oxidoreductase